MQIFGILKMDNTVKDGRVSNRRLIYSKTDYLDEDKIKESIYEAMKEGGIIGEIYVNIVSAKGRMCKYSYLWGSNEGVFDFLMKFGVNGKIVYDKVVKDESVTNNVLSKSVGNSNSNSRFIDMTDDDETVVAPVSTSKVIKKEINMKLMEYSEELSKHIELTDPKYNKKGCILQFEPGLFVPINDETDEQGRIHNVWYANKVDNFVTIKHLLSVLRKFVTNPNKKDFVKFSKNKNKLHYPHINIRETHNGKTVLVTFDPDTHDGQAALYMCRQLPIIDGKNKTVIYFNHFIDKSKKNKREESDPESDSEYSGSESTSE